MNKEKNIAKKTSNTHLNEEFWNETENKANTEEGATNLRKNTDFSEQLNAVFKYLLVDDKITDKKLLNQIVKIIVLMLMKGKFDSQHPNIDITKNQNILNYSLLIFKISLSDEHQNLLNDIIKVIGLFAKFSVYFSNGIRWVLFGIPQVHSESPDTKRQTFEYSDKLTESYWHNDLSSEHDDEAFIGLLQNPS